MRTTALAVILCLLVGCETTGGGGGYYGAPYPIYTGGGQGLDFTSGAISALEYRQRQREAQAEQQYREHMMRMAEEENARRWREIRLLERQTEALEKYEDGQ